MWFRISLTLMNMNFMKKICRKGGTRKLQVGACKCNLHSEVATVANCHVFVAAFVISLGFSFNLLSFELFKILKQKSNEGLILSLMPGF